MENRKVVTLIVHQKRIPTPVRQSEDSPLMLCQDHVAGRKTIDEFLTGIEHNIRWTSSTNRQAE